ncbi:PH domain-containing protein [Peterkaempfera sp. SMS 1(5)a]|uniref:PH domain-containing protein n=1 Tax=Peterkaempfera podocarpi TaxID=3232308 RepID=UPI00366A64AD
MTDPAGENGPDRETPGSPAPQQPRQPEPADRPRPADQPGPVQADRPVYADRVYRSTMGVIGGVLLLAVALWLIVDAVVYGTGRTPWVALSAALLFVPLVAAYTLRPVVRADQERLTVRNPLRTVVAPWATVESLRSGYSVELFAGGGKYQIWAVPVSLRQRKRATTRAARAAAEDPYAGRDDRGSALRPGARRSAVAGAPDPTRAWSDQVVDTLRETAERNAGRPEAAGEVSATWCWWIIVPAAVGLVALVTLIATG